MESVEHQHQHQAATRLSRSPPNPAAPPSPPLSPDSAAAAALANARWTPTKEQIGVLEGLYRQGLRTPTAEQIQQVTARLQKHGPIEGKNVFYWFQNHKARQRQRQKQQAFDYFSRQFRRPQPLPVLHRPAAHPSLPPVPLHPPPPHVPSATPDPPAPPASACNRQAMYRQQPCYVTAAVATQAAANAPYYLQAQTQTPMLYPRVETVAHDKVSTQAPATAHYQAAAPNNAGTQQPRALPFPPAAGSHGPPGARSRRPETLNLFPLHPTFAIPEKTRPAGIASSATPTRTPTAPSASGSGSFSWEPESASGDASLPLYDFFGVGR